MLAMQGDGRQRKSRGTLLTDSETRESRADEVQQEGLEAEERLGTDVQLQDDVPAVKWIDWLTVERVLIQ